MDRYKKEKADIKTAAEKLEADATHWDKQSDDQMYLHHRWAQATTALQVSIALAAMALLTRHKWLEYGMFGVAGAGGCAGRAGDAARLTWVAKFSWTEVFDWWLPRRQEARPDPDATTTSARGKT